MYSTLKKHAASGMNNHKTSVELKLCALGLGDILIYSNTIIANKDIAIIANIALEYLASIINMCIMSECYNNCTKTWSIVDTYLHCVLNPMVLHCNTYVMIYCIYNIIAK